MATAIIPSQLKHARGALLTVARTVSSTQSQTLTCAPSSSLLTSPPSWAENQIGVRHFASKKKNSSNDSSSDKDQSYNERKRLAKEKRREAYNKKMARLASRKDRRSHSTKGIARNKFRSYFDNARNREEALDRQARRAGLPWKITVSGIVERLPVITPDKPTWEKEYEDMMSYLGSISGKEYPPELANAGDSAAATAFPDEADDGKSLNLSDEELLALLKEHGYTPAPRETEADRTGDVRTLDRQLKTRAYLVIQPKKQSSASSDPKWAFPTVEVKHDETLLSAAKRSITTSIGTELEFWCPSNCPLGVQMHPYEDEQLQEKEGFFGVKNFFVKVQLDRGDVDQQNMNVQDWAWLTREEMAGRVKEEQGEDCSKFYHYLL